MSEKLFWEFPGPMLKFYIGCQCIEVCMKPVLGVVKGFRLHAHISM